MRFPSVVTAIRLWPSNWWKICHTRSLLFVNHSCNKNEFWKYLLLTLWSLHISDCTGQESCKIIFQLGVLILELVTGQSSEMEGSDLIEWIQESRFFSSIDKMLDPDLGNSFDCTELKSLLAVAKLCIKSWDKPSYTVPQLFRYLQKKINIPQD